MRARIDGLIRLHRWQLDEKRRTLADLENMRQDFEDKLSHLQGELEREKTFVAGDPERGLQFGEFLAASRAREQAIRESIEDIDAQIDAARRDVEASFLELKKMETFEARQKSLRERTAIRREQARMDELGIERHRRAAKA